METKTIKISKENYLWLLNLAAEIQKHHHKPVSFDDAINKLKTRKKKKESILDLAGRWKMTDDEAEKFKKDIMVGWGKWEIPSF